MAGLELENLDTDINQDFIESDYTMEVRLDEFEWLDIEDITQLIKSAPNKTWPWSNSNIHHQRRPWSVHTIPNQNCELFPS